MKRVFSLAAFIIGAAALTFAQGGNVLVIRNVTLIDGTGRGSVTNATVVIEGNIIKDAGAHAQAPAGGRTIDGTGTFLIPGLIDAHIHLRGGRGEASASEPERDAARALGKLDELGTIEAGKLADLVLLKADPTKDINNAKLVDLVIKNGQVVDRSKLDLPVNRRPATQQ